MLDFLRGKVKVRDPNFKTRTLTEVADEASRLLGRALITAKAAASEHSQAVELATAQATKMAELVKKEKS